MASTRALALSRSYPVEIDAAFAAVITAPLERVFARRYAALPAVRAVRDQQGTWGTVGQTRTIVLGDGGTMHEQLTAVLPGERFDYRIGHVTGPMKVLAASLDGRWAFEPAGTGTRVTWTWDLQPASSAAGLAMPAFARLWRGYARQGLEELEGILLGS